LTFFRFGFENRGLRALVPLDLGKCWPQLLAGPFQYLLGRIGVGGAGGEQNGSLDNAAAGFEQLCRVVPAAPADGGDDARRAVAQLDVVGGEIDL
jgi:hypothetical protein